MTKGCTDQFSESELTRSPNDELRPWNKAIDASRLNGESNGLGLQELKLLPLRRALIDKRTKVSNSRLSQEETKKNNGLL